jgi:hypothetical protein
MEIDKKSIDIKLSGGFAADVIAFFTRFVKGPLVTEVTKVVVE